MLQIVTKCVIEVLAECIFYGDCVWFVVDGNKLETREGVRLNMVCRVIQM